MTGFGDACRIVVLSCALLVLVKTTCGQLPCTHPLRLSAPHLFRHCTSQPSGGCSYSSYSDWKPVPGSVQTVSKSSCSSGKTYQEKRTRTGTGSSCTQLSQTRRVCLPDQEDQLILALGLGSSGRNLNPVNNGGGRTIQPLTNTKRGRIIPLTRTGGGGWSRRAIRFSRIIRIPIRRPQCPRNNNVGNVCRHLTGKRSALQADEFSPAESIEEEIEEDEDPAFLAEAPVPFDWNDHGPRLRRHVQTCDPNEIQHVLFVLDSSGSIGSHWYGRMKKAIGKLVPLFCKQVKFAMVTYSRDINLEFCFDCFQNTYSGRAEAKKAVEKARYHNSMTNTGATTKCICDTLLSSSCGISSNPSCLDVVYITDGKSNDPTYKVCNEVKCLHRKSGINTYGIGIKNFNQAELNCISHSSSILSAFRYDSFIAFEQSIETIVQRLAEAISGGHHYSCLQRSSNISPTGSVPYSGKR